MIFRAVIAVFALFVATFGANITSYNFISSPKNFDLILSFDEPFVYGIKEQKAEGKSIIILEKASIKDAVFESSNLKFLSNISIFNIKGGALQLEFSAKSPLQISAAKTPDKKGMRIRVTQKAVKSFSELGAQKSNGIDGKYIAVVIVLLLLCAGLFVLKYLIEKKKINLNALFKNLKIAKKTNNSTKNATLNKNFQNENSTKQAPKKEEKTSSNLEFSQIAANFGIKTNEDLKIIFEKSLDENNKVVLLEHENRRYLVLVGRSNILLDRFGEDIIETRNDFERFFEQNKERLGSFISRRQSSLENYEKKLTEDKE